MKEEIIFLREQLKNSVFSKNIEKLATHNFPHFIIS